MRERASERPNDRQDGFTLRFRQASRASENRDFLHAKFNARIPAIAAMLNSAFRSCQPVLLLFSFFFARARADGDAVLHNRKGTVPVQGRAKRAFIASFY